MNPFHIGKGDSARMISIRRIFIVGIVIVASDAGAVGLSYYWCKAHEPAPVIPYPIEPVMSVQWRDGRYEVVYH